MVEAKFTFLEMDKKVFASNAAAFRQSRFRGAPETLDAIDMHAAAADKDTVAVLDAEMFAVPEVDQAVVANPAVGMNDAGQRDAPANNGPQSGLFGVGHDLRVDAALALEDAKDDRLAAGSAAAFAANPTAAEIRFVDFHGAADRGMFFALARHANPEGLKVAVDRAAADMRELRHFRGFEIERKQAHDLPKFGLRNMRTENIAIEGRQY